MLNMSKFGDDYCRSECKTTDFTLFTICIYCYSFLLLKFFWSGYEFGRGRNNSIFKQINDETGDSSRHQVGTIDFSLIF